MSGSRKFCQMGSNFGVCLFDEEREGPSNSKSGLATACKRAKRLLNGVSLACR